MSKKQECRDCGKTFEHESTRNLTICPECKKERFERGCIEKYGSYEAFLKERRRRQTERTTARYGASSPWKVPGKKGEIVAKSKATRLERYGDENYCNSKKSRESFAKTYAERGDEIDAKKKATCLKNHGYENVLRDPDARAKFFQDVADAYTDGDVDALRSFLAEKSVATKREKNGGKVLTDEHKAKLVAAGTSSETREKILRTCLEKYGVDNPFKLTEFQLKADATRLERHGDAHYSNREKARKTCLERYGYEVPHGHTPKYLFEGLEFDSSWELYYFLWLRDSGVEFEYKPRGIRYAKDGTPHFYYPDFLVESRYVDVKGDHLYRDGWLTSPSGKHVFREKTMCYREHGVEVVTSSGMKPAFEYVDAKYGASYVRSFRMGRAPDA